MPRAAIISLTLVCTVLLAEDSKLSVGVGLFPIESLVREIGGDAVEVRSLQGEGDSCSVFEPRPSAIAALADTSLYFKIGAAFENSLLHRIESRFPSMQVVDIREGIPVRSTPGHDHNHDHHGHENCSGHEDPHIWMDPVLLQKLAWNVAAALGDALPQLQPVFEQRAVAFCGQLESLHQSLQSRLEPFKGKAFFIYHPALGYFADRYQLEQVAIESSSNSTTVRELHRFVSMAKQQRIAAIFVQPQENRRHAETVASAVGAEVIEIDPMSTSLVANLDHISALLEAVFEGE